MFYLYINKTYSMKKIPSNNSLFGISNISNIPIKVYTSAIMNKINDEFLEEIPYNAFSSLKDTINPNNPIQYSNNNAEPITDFCVNSISCNNIKIYNFDINYYENYNIIHSLLENKKIYSIGFIVIIVLCVLQNINSLIYKSQNNKELPSTQINNTFNEYLHKNHIEINIKDIKNTVNMCMLILFIIFTRNIENAI